MSTHETSHEQNPSSLPSSSIFILGQGRLGQALSYALQKQNDSILGTWNRTASQHLPSKTYCGELPIQPLQRASVLILAVADGAIESLAHQIEEYVIPGQTILHCSGRLSSQVLSVLHKRGCHIGSFHPLQPITVALTDTYLFKDIFVGYEGDPKAAQKARQIINELKGKAFSLDGVDRSLYHAAAVCASNYLVTLAHISTQLWTASGLHAPGQSFLLPLMKQAVHHLETKEIPDALTGPIARGDTETIRQHLDAIQSNIPECLDVYIQLAQHTVPIAKQTQHAKMTTETNSLNELNELLQDALSSHRE